MPVSVGANEQGHDVESAAAVVGSERQLHGVTGCHAIDGSHFHAEGTDVYGRRVPLATGVLADLHGKLERSARGAAPVRLLGLVRAPAVNRVRLEVREDLLEAVEAYGL